MFVPEDHESINGYAYANNTPVTKSDPTGLRPITDCERGCSGEGGTYRDYMTMGPNGTWVYHSTQTYTQTFLYQKKGGGVGSGTMAITIRTDAGHKSAQVVLKKGPDPKPKKDDGHCNACWAMGTNPQYDPSANDLPDVGELATWQKVALGAVVGVALAVAVAPVAVGPGLSCLATAPVCAAEIAEIATSGASGGSAAVGSAALAGAAGGLARRTTNTGVFSELQVPMQKRAVKEIAGQAGVGLDGVKIKINRDSDLLGRGLYGHTAPDGTITLYPDAFTSSEDLVRTIGHERMHVMQVQLYGSASSLDEEAAWEKAAYAAEEQFWNFYNRKLK
ncbi:hypothetical protein SUDANB54_07006 (plasmid) [Streptomyces sp. enrichment culture]